MRNVLLLSVLVLLASPGAQAQERYVAQTRFGFDLMLVEPALPKSRSSLSDISNQQLGSVPGFPKFSASPPQETTERGVVIPAITSETGGVRSSVGARGYHGGVMLIYRTQIQ